MKLRDFAWVVGKPSNQKREAAPPTKKPTKKKARRRKVFRVMKRLPDGRLHIAGFITKSPKARAYYRHG